MNNETMLRLALSSLPYDAVAWTMQPEVIRSLMLAMQEVAPKSTADLASSILIAFMNDPELGVYAPAKVPS